MYLKSLELQGFKSFPDKIKLNFDKGLTAVVGPNGSGKSNIGDSVRWVLGEQSTKTLRGSKMEDVIFSGTVGRKPMGFASLRLVIDNSENRLEGYGDEVSVTRKLYRSGDSEYRINGKAVRLKDINELFMDTGLGRDGYSIIGQGRIAEIVGAKSNDRREIFEEAAGISKFRYRKAEAERKLDQAQEKMERVQDIFQELESRLSPLKLQAQKAEKYLVLAKEEKQLEVSVWIQQLADLQQKLKILEEKFIVSRTEYENAERNIRNQEEEIQSCYLKMQEYSVESEEAHQAVKDLRAQTAQAQADIAVLRNDIIHHQEAVKLAQSRHEQDQKDQSAQQKKLEEAQKQAESMMQIFTDTQQALTQAQKRFAVSEQAFLTEDENSRQTDEALHQLYLERSELQFAIRSDEEKADQISKEIQSTEEATLGTEQDLKQAEENYQSALSAMQEIQNQITAQETEITKFREALNQARQQKNQAEEQFRQIGFQMRDKKQRHRILTDLENHMEGFSGSVKAVMRAVQNGNLKSVFGSVAQLIQVDQQYGIAVETALGASVQHIIVADETAAKAGIQFLKDSRAGRATFLPLTTIRGRKLNPQDIQEISRMPGFIAVASDLAACDAKYRQIAENLLGRIIIADQIDNAAAIARKSGYKYRIVTADGQVINAGGSFTGGSVQKTGGMLTRKTELNALQNEIQNLALQCTQAEQSARQTADACIQAEKNLDAQSRIFEQLRQKFMTAQTDAQKEAFPVSQYRQQLQKQTALMTELKQQSAQADSSLAEKKLQYANKLQEIQQAEEMLSGMKNRKSELLTERQEAFENYTNLKIKLAQTEKDKESAEQTLLQIQNMITNTQDREKQYLSELENYQKQITQKTQEIQQKEIFFSETEQKISSAEQKAKSASKNHDAQSIQIRSLQSDLNTLHTEKEKLSAEVSRLSERQNSMQTECDQIINKLLEVYELTRSEAQAFAQPVEDMTEAKKQLSVLKQKIRSLGAVNTEAIAEFKEVSERHAFYSREMTDIKKARQELEKMIQELTGEMCRIFSENFQIINQNFKEIFQDLFGGGRAELTLTEPEHVLTSGIEINVAPPGKVIKNLISLSGGEQSFVAIAIYFAILRLRPAPFCILDEIDAALDEANVRKYARYLKHFTDNTQFVLVTHRRSAMEEASVLYGVTMQEDGISRLLRLEQPEDMPEENLN